MDEGANICIYDPKVKREQIIKDLKMVSRDDPSRVDKLITIVDDPYIAMEGSHAVAVLTEWTEFSEYDYERVYATMPKPAYIFDGRSVLDHTALKGIGFQVECIGKVMRKRRGSGTWG